MQLAPAGYSISIHPVSLITTAKCEVPTKAKDCASLKDLVGMFVEFICGYFWPMSPDSLCKGRHAEHG